MISTNQLFIPKSIFSRKGQENKFNLKKLCKIFLTKEKFISFYKIHEFIISNIGNLKDFFNFEMNQNFKSIEKQFVIPKLMFDEEVIKESEKPLIEMKEKIEQPSTSKITKATIKDIKDVEIKNYIDSIIFEAQQFKTIYTEGDNESQDFDYIKNILPKLLSRTIQNYLEFTRTKDPFEVKKNTLIQLKLLNKKTFEILNKSLEK